ncbi:MAG: ADP-ribosylglycohydrolase family protein [Thermomicrobiales bacterium]
MTNHDSRRRDRIAGTMLGLAAGDALRAGYEFGPPLPDDIPISMTGGGAFAWEPGEWTDDTGMAVAIARAIRDTGTPDSHEAAERVLDAIAAQWAAWARVSKDIGNQTRAIFSAAGLLGPHGASADRLREEALAFHARTGRSAGNGSLMWTAPVALATLDGPPQEVAAWSRRISELTHADDTAGDACVLWNLAIRNAIETGAMDIRVGLPFIAESRQASWRDRIAAAESSTPKDFPRNGWVVEAFQAAWSAIVSTRRDGEDHLVRALEAAVRGGHDTDTVAAIAGSLLGAACGASAIPPRWSVRLHGWPGIDAAGLTALALTIALP